jgi:hypothetical protein
MHWLLIACSVQQSNAYSNVIRFYTVFTFVLRLAFLRSDCVHVPGYFSGTPGFFAINFFGSFLPQFSNVRLFECQSHFVDDYFCT